LVVRWVTSGGYSGIGFHITFFELSYLEGDRWSAWALLAPAGQSQQIQQGLPSEHID
jgi:hypothetical protein